MRFEDLHGQQSDQSSAGDDKGFAKRGLSKPNALQADTSHHDKGSRFVIDIVGNMRTKIFGDPDHVGVGPIGGHAITHGETFHTVADRNHAPDITIAQSQRLGELRPYSLKRCNDAVGARFFEDHLHSLRLLERLLNQTRTTEIH